MANCVSLKPSDAIAGGGLLDNEDVRVIKSRIGMLDYQGKQQPVPAIEWTLERMNGEGNTVEFWKIANPDHWAPSDDGKGLVAIGRETELKDSTNAMKLIVSLINAGYPEDRITEDVSLFEGLECHLTRVAAERAGLENTKGKTTLTVAKINKYPWEADTPKSKGKSKGKSKAKTTPAPEANKEDTESKATTFILELLAENPDGIEKAKIAPAVFKKFQKDDPARADIVQLIYHGDEFLNSGPWKYEGGVLSMG